MFRIIALFVVGLLLFSLQSAFASNFKHGDKIQDCPECPRLIVVKGGVFIMGSLKTEDGRDGGEEPRRAVRIRKFAVGQFEITRKQYHTFIKETGYNPGDRCYTNENSSWELRAGRNYLNPGFPQEDNHPVTCVNWFDAKVYTLWLSKKTGKHYRLLTEAEWEYVASANRKTAFWWGSSISTEQANYNGTRSYNGAKGIFRQRTVAVDSFTPNPFGLYNVHGNVFEWVEDCWHYNYKDAPTDGSAWLNANGGNCGRHVLRGGAWFYYPQYLRARYRYSAYTNVRNYYNGFRVARELG